MVSLSINVNKMCYFNLCIYVPCTVTHLKATLIEIECLNCKKKVCMCVSSSKNYCMCNNLMDANIISIIKFISVYPWS